MFGPAGKDAILFSTKAVALAENATNPGSQNVLWSMRVGALRLANSGIANPVRARLKQHRAGQKRHCELVLTRPPMPANACPAPAIGEKAPGCDLKPLRCEVEIRHPTLSHRRQQWRRLKRCIAVSWVKVQWILWIIGNPMTMDLPAAGRNNEASMGSYGSMMPAISVSSPIRRPRLASAIWASTQDRPLKIAVPVPPARARRAASSRLAQISFCRFHSGGTYITATLHHRPLDGRALPFIGRNPFLKLGVLTRQARFSEHTKAVKQAVARMMNWIASSISKSLLSEPSVRADR
jgi:hypothetical protein